MRFTFLSLSIVGLSALTHCQPTAEDASRHLMSTIVKEYSSAISSSLPSGSCNKKNVAVRREWETLSKSEKLDYLDAVKCLQSKKPTVTGSQARTRYEEWVLSHINVTLDIHFSGLLLPWHRYFIWLHEKALREECGYTGYQPYWDWSKYIVNTKHSTIFDGSEHSFGGNGQYVPHGATNITQAGGAPPVVYLIQPPGTGGGCVTSGPFANYTLHLDAANNGTASPVRIFESPRCLRRDFSLPVLKNQNSYQNVSDIIFKSNDIREFLTTLDLANGIHPGGHSFIGGENNNLFTSPSDPLFFLHHANVDRVWSMWQSRDLETRTLALYGTLTWSNYPPSPNATVDDIMDMGPLGSKKILDVMSTVDKILCYKYE
ncbi:hypothetical protein ACHAPO_010611 [Fusarium lateritium]